MNLSSIYELSIIKCSKSIHYQSFFPVPKSQGSFYAKSICDCDWLSCFAKNKNWHQLLSIHVENNFYNMGKGKLRGLYKYTYHSSSGTVPNNSYRFWADLLHKWSFLLCEKLSEFLFEPFFYWLWSNAGANTIPKS